MKIVFLEDHIEKLLNEIGYPIDSILMEGKKGGETDYLKSLSERIGKYDYLNIEKIDGYFNSLVFNKYVSLFGTLYNVVDEESNAINSRFLRDGEIDFKDTYSIMLLTDGTVVIKIKEGFTNFINSTKNAVYYKSLLSEVINKVKRDNLFDINTLYLYGAYNKLSV